MPPAATRTTAACSCPSLLNSLGRKFQAWTSSMKDHQMGRLVLGYTHVRWKLFLCMLKVIFKTFVSRELKLKGISTPRGSLQMRGVNKEAGELTEVTCDKVSLTKNEYVQSQLLFHSCLSNSQVWSLSHVPSEVLQNNHSCSILYLIFSCCFFCFFFFTFLTLSDWFVICLEQENTAG